MLPSIMFEEDVWQPLQSEDAASGDSPTQTTPNESDFSFEQRRALATLLVEAVARDDRLCDVFLGILLPPPWRGVHGVDDNTEEEEPLLVLRSRIINCVASLPVEWRQMVCLMPINFALKAGAYDARLRVAMRRLTRLLGVSWEVVEKREGALSAIDLDELKDVEEKRGAILARKENSKYSVKRVAAIGTFAAVGGVALFFTGGLAAPVIAPAFTALIGATTATLGFVGSIGTAVLGGGAIAAAFAAIIGVATHAAAMAAVLTPLLSAANLTALFGAGGAGLAGWKGARRTGESSRFMIRSVDEVETLPPLRMYLEDGDGLEKFRIEDEVDDYIASGPTTTTDVSIDAQQPSIVSSVVEKVSSAGASTVDDFNDELFSMARSGLVVPVYTVNVALRNISSSDAYKSRSRVNVFAVESHLDGIRLSLSCMRLSVGVWAHVPAKEVPPRHAAVAASHNKVARPTGAGGVVCYRFARFVPRPANANDFATCVPVDPASLVFKSEAKKLCHAGGLKLWVLSHTTVTNREHLSVLIERPDCKLSRSEIVKRLEEGHVTEDTQYSVDGVLLVQLKFHPKPRVVLSYLPQLGRPSLPSSFLVRELGQHLEDQRHGIDRRRVLTIVIKNMMKQCAIHVKSIQCLTGLPLVRQAAPDIIRAGEATIIIFTNKEYSLEGAAASLALEIQEVTHESSSETMQRQVSGRLVADLNAIGQTRAATLFHLGSLRTFPTSSEVPFPDLASTHDKPAPIDSLQDPDTKEPLSFLSATVRVISKDDQVEWIFADASNRLMLVETVAHRMTVAIGVCGFMDAIDPRRVMADQQVAIWQTAMHNHPLLHGSQALVVDWEEEYLCRFSKTVGLLKSETVLNEATGEVFKTGKKVIKKQLLAGALFAGLRAFDALKGTIEFPLYAIYATDLIDNTFATLSNRAEYAAKDLAAALLSGQRGNRPVTLVGFSFGATVIAKCLEELHVEKAFGVVENVYLLGGVFSTNQKTWRAMRDVVAGRIVNIYCRSDWLLWTLHKTNDLEMKPLAGLAPVHGVKGIENIDATALVDSHASYATKLESILDLIPPHPTHATLEQSLALGSPGAVVPRGEAAATAARMFSSMTTPLFETEVGVVCLTNRIDSGGAFVEDLRLVATKLHNKTTFDFVPVAAIPSNHSGLFGFLRSHDEPDGIEKEFTLPGEECSADDHQQALCGVVAYAVNLSPLSNMSILVLIYFTCIPDERRGIRCNAVALAVPHRDGELQDGLDARLADIAQHQAASAEQIVLMATMGPKVDDKENTQDFSIAQEGESQSEDWTLRMQLHDGAGMCAIDGNIALELLDETWSEMLATRRRQISSTGGDVESSPLEVRALFDGCPLDANNESIPLDALGMMVNDVVMWGLNHVALEILGSARSTILSSPSAKGYILFPFVLVNTTPYTLTLITDDHHRSPGSKDAEWIRQPPTVLCAQTGAILLLRVGIPQMPEGVAAPSKIAELYGCFSYRGDGDNEFHFFTKGQWEPQKPHVETQPLSASTRSRNATSTLLSFDFKMQCLHDTGSTMSGASTSFEAVVSDTKRVEGALVRFVFLRLPPEMNEPNDLTTSKGSDKPSKPQPVNTSSEPKEKGENATWVAFE